MKRISPTTCLIALLFLGSCGSPDPSPKEDNNPSNSETKGVSSNEESPKTHSDRAWSGAEAANQAKDVALVRTTTLQRRLAQKSLVAVADVVSLDEVDVFPERTQPIVELLVEEGDRVHSGQVLARLRDKVEQLALAEAQVRLSEAENENARAERDHARNTSLKESTGETGTQLISDRELETSRQAMVTASTAHAAAKVAQDRAKFEMEQTVIRAPIAGTIATREISLGDMANPSARAFQIVDDSQPKAIFYRPQRELSLLHKNQLFQAESEALPGRSLHGKIDRVSPVVDMESGTFKVTASLNTDAGPIPIGVLVKLRLVLDEHPQALMVPKKAIQFKGKEMFCFVVQEDKAVRVSITPGFEEPNFIEALSVDGSLKAGDEVVMVGADRLADGDSVEIATE
ncbi:MAG: efflux RND transporter periplasmic adaptor subunit [Planctomycetota bacterium]|jgi:RND family efflux transporter MFP subunit|nr:efflux RND transporter periplasmic adaptor subunit [Planctomycetota bacterium]MDP6941118.1 efflux RND transporter periplasmic adaptor subunit [Planctomycetota bacterium]